MQRRSSIGTLVIKMYLPDLLKAHARDAAKVALCVGTVLLVINQYDALFGKQTLRWWPALLSYCVPLCVYLYGKYSAASDAKMTGKPDCP